MKRINLAIAFGGLALLSICSLVGECKAHRKYNKGWNDGMKFAFAVKDLEHTLEEILENHNENDA